MDEFCISGKTHVKQSRIPKKYFDSTGGPRYSANTESNNDQKKEDRFQIFDKKLNSIYLLRCL